MDVRTQQARFAKSYARWEARRQAKFAAQAADPAYIAHMREEGARDARLGWDNAQLTEPDNVWTRQDPYAVAWREEWSRIGSERLWAE
jgi:hypothetical protein